MADETKDSNPGETYHLVASLIGILAKQDGEALMQAIVESSIGIDVADPVGRTLLMHAVHCAGTKSGERKRMLSGITCPLRHGEDVNLPDSSGDTALSVALRLRQKRCRDTAPRTPCHLPLQNQLTGRNPNIHTTSVHHLNPDMTAITQ
ncbi:MAG TPA: hypothetical protein VGR71_17060 [Nitrospira sp.]|nr:hypothetical protein [Nitrospira sp.]